jgi:hypothetical protein
MSPPSSRSGVRLGGSAVAAAAGNRPRHDNRLAIVCDGINYKLYFAPHIA